MTKQEHLEAILSFCRARIADRTPWHPWCIAGWEATIADIEFTFEIADKFGIECVQPHIDIILAAYPEDMLKP